MVIVRLPALPPRRMLEAGTRFVFKAKALTFSKEAGVVESAIVNAIGPVDVSSLMTRLVMVEIVGFAFAARRTKRLKERAVLLTPSLAVTVMVTVPEALFAGTTVKDPVEAPCV